MKTDTQYQLLIMFVRSSQPTNQFQNLKFKNMIVLKAMFVGMFLIMVILGWVVVIATEKVVEKLDDEPESPHTEDSATKHEDAPEILAGSEMPKEMVDAMIEKPKRGRPRKSS